MADTRSLVLKPIKEFIVRAISQDIADLKVILKQAEDRVKAEFNRIGAASKTPEEFEKSLEEALGQDRELGFISYLRTTRLEKIGTILTNLINAYGVIDELKQALRVQLAAEVEKISKSKLTPDEFMQGLDATLDRAYEAAAAAKKSRSTTATVARAFAHEGAGARVEHKSGNDSSDSEDESQPGSARVHPAPSFHTARTAPSSREGSPTQTPAGNVTPPRMQLHGAGEMKEPSAPVQEQPKYRDIHHIPEEEMREIRASNAAFKRAKQEKEAKERQAAEARKKKDEEVAAAIAAMEADEKRSKKGKCAIM